MAMFSSLRVGVGWAEIASSIGDVRAAPIRAVPGQTLDRFGDPSIV